VIGRGRHLPPALAVLAILAGGARADDSAADLEAQHQAALAVLNNPPLTGLLITEVEPESAAAGAGMRGGDILTEYHGTRVTTLQTLTELVADALARRLEGAAVGNDVLARVRRGDRELILVLPRAILGLRLIEVKAGVPGPRNPPPNLRGTLDMDWKAVLQTSRTEGAQGPAAFRTFERSDPRPDGPSSGTLPVEEWTGWELCTIEPVGEDGIVGSIERHHLVPSAAPLSAGGPPPATERTTFTFRLRLGDYKTLPAFVLEEVAARYPATTGLETARVVATATRRGETLQTTSGTAADDNAAPAGGAPHEIAAPLNAIPQSALPWVAAALPQAPGDALAVYLLSIRDLLPRPGYVLATRGRQPMPADPDAGEAPATASAPATAAAPIGWRVDLMLCGVVLESYWFSDRRGLLCVETFGPQSIVVRRVDNAKTAATPLERKLPPRKP
jgi:hypothetical protein